MRRKRAPSPKLDEFGRAVVEMTRSRSRSLKRKRVEEKKRQAEKEAEQKRLKEEQRLREREERLAQIKLEPDAEKRLRELTNHALWRFEGPRPPGSDLSLYHKDKYNGYVAKDKSGWVYNKNERTWYQKLTGVYYTYIEANHWYEPADGSQVPLAAPEPPEPSPEVIPEREVPEKIEIATEKDPEKPPSLKSLYEDSLGPDRQLLFGSDASPGRKDFMEDRHVENVMLGKLGVLFAVYDGHGGSACSQYAQDNLHKVLHAQWKARADLSFDALAEAIISTFEAVDERFLRIAEKKDLEDGSTALVCVLRGTKPSKPVELLVANAGDCRAVLCRAGEAVRLSRDHKPDLADERRRIEKAGGKVVHAGGCWRVTHESMFKDQIKSFLSVTRALGDRGLKTPFPLLTCKPELQKVELGDTDLFLVLACDGVWDVLSDQEAVDLAAQSIGDPKKGAQAIIRECYERKSGDNLTAVVITFQWQLERAPQMLDQYSALKKHREAQVSDVAAASESLDIFA